MSAIPVNDDERPVSLACFTALRSINSMDDAEMGMVAAAAIGALHASTGPANTARVVTRIMDALVPVRGSMTLSEVALRVACKHGVTVSALRAGSEEPDAKAAPIAEARQEAYWLAREQRTHHGRFLHSFPKIGRFFGERDHTTVCKGVAAHQERAAMRGERGMGV